MADVVGMIYPDLCLACDRPLNRNERIMCIRCQLSLPKTDYATFDDNPVAKKFWGKVRVEHAMAMYHFHKAERIQQLMHALKYRGRKDVGERFGQLLGYQLNACESYRQVDMIMAVPLHPLKEQKRGYNQSNLIAEGLSMVMEKDFEPFGLQRTIANSTQTKKSRLARWENVKNIFQVSTPEKVKGHHILIVDDVITTGSTLESCACALTEICDVKVSIAAVAHAEL